MSELHLAAKSDLAAACSPIQNRGLVSNTSSMRFADTAALGSIIKIIVSMVNAMMTCMAYDEKTTILEKIGSLSEIPAASIK